ncbi:hypothetical protein MOTT16_01450 [Moraxella osloensis]|uniref:DUF3999 domain-containing protein n=1 Tax=Faucicola osloensis TaxID=34062 RepID=A0AAD0EXJ7_FAUOS|nr:DUF3999 family protein [Moraxella osloensis]ATQ82609.1 hypothetical protein YHS_01455 [Moraxella osloensis]ATW85110.1 hypothetical protein MOTT16_01450 [Moraxella osloensis]
MKNNKHCPVKLAKYRACILSATLVSPLLLIAIIYTQADAQNPTQTASASIASQTQTTTTMVVPAIVDNSEQEQEHGTDSISYGFEALQNSFAIDIDLPGENQEDNPNSAQLVKFSSLTPSLLALIMLQNGAAISDKQNYRLIDAKGHIMPMAIRPVSKQSSVNQVLQVVSVETDNPNAVEKLRHALTVQLDNPDNQQSINIDLSNLPSNPVAAVTNSPVRTWWLTNPNFAKNQSTLSTEQAVNLWLKFLPVNSAQPSKRPLQLQIYGSDDLQSWQMVSQTVASPFDPSQRGQPSQATQHSQMVAPQADGSNQPIATGNAIAIEPQQANYRYWQVVANQPINLEAASLNRMVSEASFFLTRASFSKTKDDANQWRLSLAQPMLTTGVSFFVPENQLWQVSINVPEQEANQLAKINKTANVSNDKTLANSQIDKNHTTVSWQPTLTKSLQLGGQMQQDDLPVDLLTPMYEMYFLAQGTAPYRLVINEPRVLQQPNITLSNQQLTSLGNTVEGQMQNIEALNNPNASFERYKIWALWGVLAAIVAALALIALRLYQQTTTQAPKE